MSVTRGIARSLAEITEPLLLAVQYREALEGLLADLGWRLELTEPQAQALRAVMPAINELQDLADLAADPDAEAGDWVAQALDLGEAIFNGVRQMQSLNAQELATLPAPLNDSDNFLPLALDLPEYLLLRWLGTSWPALYSTLYFAGVIEETPRGGDLPPRKQLVWTAVETLLTDPAEQIRSTYNWGGELEHERLIEAFSRLAIAFGFPLRRGPLAAYLADTLTATDPEQLSVRLARGRGPGGWYEAGLLAAPTAPGGSGPARGVLLATELTGPPPPDFELGGGWSLGLGGDGPSTVSLGVRILPSGVEPALDGTPEASLELLGEPDEPWTLIGAKDGTRLELDSFRLGLGAAGPISNPELILEVDTGQGFRLVIQAGEGDSFLQSVLGDQPLAILAAFGARWSSVDGLTLSGSAGLEVAINIGKTVGPLSVLTLHIAVVGGSGGLEIRIGVSGTLVIGPFAAAAENVGVKAALAPPPEGENGDIGPLDVNIGFLPPTGFGFSIAVGDVVEGGGFLSLDHEKGEYAGILDIQFVKFGLTAIGMISTRLPDGSDGWSIFFSLSLRLSGIQLGFGFTLNGVGGLAGINRGMDVQALQSGLSTGAMDAVLFPEDPIANAPTILANLEAIFPAQADQYVFGPVLAIGWGTPTLIEIQLGVIVQLPDPITIALLGSIDAILPDPEAAVVELHFVILGVADLTAGTLSIDASLYDSQIVGFSLSGDMALRASFKEDPTLLLAVGGFHPDFTPPEGFPALARMTLGLATNPYLGMYFECYGAITSNTVQFGAGFEIWAKALGFVAEGGSGFDALIQFSPFKLKTSLDFYVTVRAGKWELVSVTLYLELTGPNPWRGIGTATFKFLGAEKDFHVDETFGNRRGEEPQPVIHVESRVIAALEDPEAWRVEPGAGGASTVPSLTVDAEAAAPDGVLRITQNIAPLGVQMTKFAEAAIDGPSLIEISEPRLGGEAIEGGSVTDWFAPAQFTQINKKQRVSAPSFELYDAGVELSDDSVAGGEELEFALDYETILIDKDLDKAQEMKQAAASEKLQQMLDAEKTVKHQSAFGLAPATWTVADGDTGEKLETAPTFLHAQMLAGERAGRALRPAYELEVVD